MKKTLSTITTLTLVLLLGITLTNPVSAQGGTRYCVPGTENTTCEPCVPGPYNICLPDTDIEIGNVTITDETILLIAATFGLGLALVLNGSYIKQKFLGEKSK